MKSCDGRKTFFFSPLWPDLAIAKKSALAKYVVPVLSLLQLIIAQNKCPVLELFYRSLDAVMIIIIHVVGSVPYKMHIVFHSAVKFYVNSGLRWLCKQATQFFLWARGQDLSFDIQL